MSTWASSLLGPDVFFSQTFVFLLFCFLLIFFFLSHVVLGRIFRLGRQTFFSTFFFCFLYVKLLLLLVSFSSPSSFLRLLFFIPLQFKFVVVLYFAIEHSIIMYWIVELPRCVTTPHLVFFFFFFSWIRILCVCPFIVNQVGIESRDAHRRFLSFCGDSFLIVSDEKQQQQNNTYWNSSFISLHICA